MAGSGNTDKIFLAIKAVDELYLPGTASFLFRAPKGYSKTYSIKPTTQFKFLFSSFCVSLGLEQEALDFIFVTNNTPLCPKSTPQHHLMISGDIIMVLMKKTYYLPQVPASNLAQQFRPLVNNPSHSDITFLVGGGHFKVYAHKAILCTRCEKFRSMFQNNMIESAQNEISLQIENSAVLLALLEYIYTDTVENFTYDLAFDLMALADEYLLPRLRQICEIQLQSFVNSDNVCEILIYAHNHNANDLKQYCLNYCLKNFETVSTTQGYEELKTDPDILLEISKLLPNHLAQPIDLAKQLTPKTSWSAVFFVIPIVFVVAAVSVYVRSTSRV